MTTDEKLAAAMNLLERVEDAELVPDSTWYSDYYFLTGTHAILTEEGWEGGEMREWYVEEYGEDYILEEVNAPVAE